MRARYPVDSNRIAPPPQPVFRMPPKRLGLRRRKRGIKKEESYKIYIFRLLKLVRPNNTISSKAMSIMNSLVNDLFLRVAQEASLIAQKNKKATLSWKEIQTAVRLVYPGELAIHACAEGVRAKGKFEIFTEMDKNIRLGARPTLPLFE